MVEQVRIFFKSVKILFEHSFIFQKVRLRHHFISDHRNQYFHDYFLRPFTSRKVGTQRFIHRAVNERLHSAASDRSASAPMITFASRHHFNPEIVGHYKPLFSMSIKKTNKL